MMRIMCAVAALAATVSANELACNKAFSSALTTAAVAGKSAGCGPVNSFQRCILGLNLGEPATSTALEDVMGHIKKCEPSGEEPTISTSEGGLEITVDARRSVKFNRRSAATVDIWELSDKVEEATKMGDTFEARFADAKSTVNQLAIDAITKCNAIGPLLKQDLAVSINNVESTLTKTTKELNALAESIQKKSENDIAKFKADIDSTVTSAVEDLTKFADATAVCSVKGQQVDQKSGKCVDYPGITFDVVSDVDKLPKCTSEIQGQVSLTTRRGLMRCVAGKWLPGMIDRLGSPNNPLKDCAEAKAEFYVADMSEETATYYVMDGKGGAKETYCNLKTGKKADAGLTAGSAGSSCQDLKKKGVVKSGQYYIDPDGAGAFKVYCEQVQDGGGWILMQHNRYGGGTNPCGLTAAYRRGWDDWMQKDLGKLSDMTGNVIQREKCYFMNFKQWGRIIGFADGEGVVDQLAMVGDTGFKNKITMENFYVSGQYGLRMSNYGEIKSMMCSGSDNCFASQAIGFSTKDRDHDNYGPHCAACNHYNCQAWWYAHCYHHNEFMAGMSREQYAGCQGSSRGKHSNCNTNHWSWFVK